MLIGSSQEVRYSLRIGSVCAAFDAQFNGSVFAEIEFNVTGNYGSPVHTNHNANYSSMPSPDMEQSDRRHSDQSRRPLSVATDNMMLEFYKKDGSVLSVFKRTSRCPFFGFE